MEWVETTGKTLVEAVDSALTALGVDESDLEYEVLQEPKSGLRGKLGMGSARIRARVKPISREKPNDRRRRRSREEKSERSEGLRSGTGRVLAPRAIKTVRGNPAQTRVDPMLETSQEKMVIGPRARARRGVEIDVAEEQGVRPAETGRELWRSQVFR